MASPKIFSPRVWNQMDKLTAACPTLELTLQCQNSIDWKIMIYGTPQQVREAANYAPQDSIDHAEEVLAHPYTFGLDMLSMYVKQAGYPHMNDEISLLHYCSIEKEGREDTVHAIVGYDNEGHLATFGGHKITGDEAGMDVWKWSCYMD